jgi:hypothetical protein
MKCPPVLQGQSVADRSLSKLRKEAREILKVDPDLFKGRY